MATSPEKNAVDNAQVPADSQTSGEGLVEDSNMKTKATGTDPPATGSTNSEHPATSAVTSPILQAQPATAHSHSAFIATAPATASNDSPWKEAGDSANTVPPDTAGVELPEVAKEAGDGQQWDGKRDKELVEEFEYLLEKSQQLFSGLSELPEIGSKYWLPHFQRTFEVYTKLWKFQSQHRLLLEKPEHYGLKRWEVGEIASKIGQLYYRYYLRTSETNYLQEAFVFYDAIRERNYFRGEQEVKNSALMIKKLRYYARFIVVCLQMNNTPMMLQLLEEVKGLIEVYSTTFNPVDKMEWSLVVKEMALFMQAVCNPVPTDDSGMMLPVSYRLVSRKRPRAEKDASKFRLQEVVVVGNRPTQIKFSELTLDMYYMLQMLEREPNIGAKDPAGPLPTSTPATASASVAAADANPTAAATADASYAVISEAAKSPEPSEHPSAAQERLDGTESAPPAAAAEPVRPESATADKEKEKGKEKERADANERDAERDKDRDRAMRRTNPHKYVLYQPSVSQIQVYLANAFREIGEQGCVLLYLSSDGSKFEAPEGTSTSEALQHGFIGGISTTRRAASEASQDRNAEQLINTLHPADLVPFTRKPFFMVVESESSTAYKNMPNLFNQPLLCLLSPTSYPLPASAGSIYTFFLHSPMVAFCVVSQITSMTASKWTGLESLANEMEDLILELINTHVKQNSLRKFLGDDFLRQIVVRHILCCVVLRLHLDFNRPEHWPQASPEYFVDVLAAPALVRKARDIIQFCEVEQFYRTDESVGELSPSPPSPVQTPPPPPPPQLSSSPSPSPSQQQQQPLQPQPPPQQQPPQPPADDLNKGSTKDA
ncbi:hypothetical protein H4R20_000224 [Coemansia guatemalensis]|uniref:Protein SCAI n=1 Tax=Coemansia guatemalensis TaxID=2761395 RepID=A0A9W8I1G7_9FUNG|nr:hypothetical protein H4R20_000224 [Coemansia guatemalensis]